jgi:DNA-binding response OmpR family regulator
VSEPLLSSTESDLARRAFLANLRHELRTPINAIIGYSEMMLEDTHAVDCPGHAMNVDVEKIYRAGHTLLALVNDNLDQAKIEAGQLDMRLDEFGSRLRHELRTPVNTIIGYAEMLTEDAPELGGGEFVPDLIKIQDAANRFLSLIDEVVNYSRIQAGDMAPDLQSDETTSLMEEALTTVQTLEAAPRQAASLEANGHILVVDDNAINRDVLSRYLERLEHTVVMAEGGRQALDVLSQQSFDLVLLDVMMPGMNGFQVLEAVKSNPVLHEIPVIMISALDEVDSVVRCIEMGAEDYLPKPFNPVLLKARLDACLEKKRLRDKEIEYLQQVSKVTTAAVEVEADQFTPASLDSVAARSDELGQLARIFQRMAREIYAREQRLKQQVQALRIQIDESKKASQVAEIAETDYFQQLQAKARQMRQRSDTT